MHAVRQLLAQRHLALLIVAGALLLKMIVPAGYMVDSHQGRITVTICSGVAPRAMTIDVPGAGGSKAEHRGSKDGGKAEMPCAFSGLSAAALAPIDPVQVAALIAFVMSVGRLNIRRPALPAPAHLRPPLRGPPAQP